MQRWTTGCQSSRRSADGRSPRRGRGRCDRHPAQSILEAVPLTLPAAEGRDGLVGRICHSRPGSSGDPTPRRGWTPPRQPLCAGCSPSGARLHALCLRGHRVLIAAGYGLEDDGLELPPSHGSHTPPPRAGRTFTLRDPRDSLFGVTGASKCVIGASKRTRDCVLSAHQTTSVTWRVARPRFLAT